MSFSVEAKELAPSFTPTAWVSARAAAAAAATADSSSISTRSGAAYGHLPAPPQAEPLKERVCMACYECGECPFGDACAHAHHFCELSPDAQTTLLMTVPVESIPSHFLSAAANPTATSNTQASAWAAADTGSRALSPYARGPSARPRAPTAGGARLATTTTTMATTTYALGHTQSPMSVRSGYRRPYADDGVSLGPSAFDTVSHSSRDSSSHTGSPRGKPASQPPTLDGFRMHLPARCRYPHKGIAGTYYSFLGVSRTATLEEIIAKYRLWQREAFRRMRSVDPVGAEAADRVIVEARNVLGNPVLRAEYDRSLNLAPAPPGVSAGRRPSSGPQPQATPAAAAKAHSPASSPGASLRHGGRGLRLEDSPTSSVWPAAVGCRESRSSPTGHHAPSSGGSGCDRASPALAITSNVFADDIW